MKCEICGKEFKDIIAVGSHLKKHDITTEEYYIEFIKKDSEGKCRNPECENNTKFLGLKCGYKDHCSNKCVSKNPEVKDKRKHTLVEIYGVDNPSKSKILQDKKKETFLKKYGVDHPLKSNEIQSKIKFTCLEKYGVDCALKDDNVKEKIKKTILHIYGVDNVFKSDEIKEQIKETILEKYGVEHPLQSDDIREKMKQTMLERYGIEYGVQSETIKEKIKQTCLEKYGVEHYSKTTEFNNKTKQTCLERYGVDHSSQTEECKEKIKQTCLGRYGVEHHQHLPDFIEQLKQTNLERYGVEFYLSTEECKDKVKKTCLEKYGVEYPTQSKEIKDKLRKVKLENFEPILLSQMNSLNVELLDEEYLGSKHPHNWKCTECDNTFTRQWNTIQQGCDCDVCNPRELFVNGIRTSRPQITLFETVQEIFSTAKLNYKILNYFIDIAIPQLKIAIEYDGSYWHSDPIKDNQRQTEIENEGWQFIRYKDEIPSKNKLIKNINEFLF